MEGIKEKGSEITLTMDVREILEAGDIDPDRVEAIIWSYCYFDHTKDPSKFGSFIALAIDLNFRDVMLPGS